MKTAALWTGVLMDKKCCYGRQTHNKNQVEPELLILENLGKTPFKSKITQNEVSPGQEHK